MTCTQDAVLAWAEHWYDNLHVPYSASKGQDARHDRLGLVFTRVLPDWSQLVEEPEAAHGVDEPNIKADAVIQDDKPTDHGEWDRGWDAGAVIDDANPTDEHGEWDRSWASSSNVVVTGSHSRNGLEPKCISLVASYFRWKSAAWAQNHKLWQKFEQNVMTLYYSRPNITKQVDKTVWK